MSTLIPHLIRDSARRLPAHIALEYKDERLSYAELEALMEKTARAVLAAGELPRRDYVLLPQCYILHQLFGSF